MIPRHNTDAELDALQSVCERLGGFDATVSVEWLDGALTALAAGPRVPALDEAIDRLLGESWPRTFADPEDDAGARAAVAARWRVLLSHLDPESLVDDPQRLRLAPLLMMADDGEVADEQWPLGAEWATGFMTIVGDPDWGWAPPRDADTEGYDAAIALIDGLRADGGTADERDERVDDAGFAVQDLRLWWIDHAPTTAPRRVEAAPGRNDPCPCGSGRKYKKCHGAG